MEMACSGVVEASIDFRHAPRLHMIRNNGITSLERIGRPVEAATDDVPRPVPMVSCDHAPEEPFGLCQGRVPRRGVEPAHLGALYSAQHAVRDTG